MKVVRKSGGEMTDATVETLSLEQPSIVHLRIAPESVARFERRGADLALVLQDGSATVLRGFFAAYPDNGRNDLVLEDDAGVMWWGQYTSPWTQFSFTEIEWLDAVPALPVTDGLPGWLIAGLAVLGLGAAAGGGGGGGGGSAPPLAPVNHSPSGEAIALEVRGGRVGQGRVDARDPDGDAVNFSVSKGPANGEVTVDPRTGEFVYTPRPGYVGTDSFEVTVDDGKGGTATVSVPVTVTNQDPVASAPPATTPEDEPISGKVTAEDSNGDTVGFTVGTPPAHGTLTLDPQTGTYTYTPNPDFHGEDSFTVIVDDGKGGRATVTVPVTVTPVTDGFVDAEETVSVAEDSGATSGSLLTGTSSVDGPLTVTSFSLAGLTGPFTLGTPYTVPGQGTITLNADGTYSFEPASNWNGVFPVVSYTVTDGTSSVISTLSIEVTPVNDAPAASDPNEGLAPGDPGYVPGQSFDPATGNYGHTTPEDQPVSGRVTGSDADGDALTYSKGNDPASGTVVVNVNGTYTYTPNLNFNGTDTFTVIVSDGNGGTSTSTVTVTVTPVNDAPVATDPNGGLAPGDPGYVPGQSFDPQTGNYGHTTVEDTPVLGRVTGSDADGDALTYTKGNDPANGAVVVNKDGSYTYTPKTDFNGVDTFTVIVSDGHGGTSTSTVTVTVTPVNDVPVATDPNGGLAPGDPGYVPGQSFDPQTGNYGHTTAEDKPVSGRVTGSDADGDALTYTKGNDPTNGTVVVNVNGSYTYTPNLNFNGTDTFTVIVSDGNGGTSTSTVTVTVTPVNDAPVATPTNASGAEDATSIAVNLAATDVDGTIDHYTIGSLPANGVLYADAALTTLLQVGSTVGAGPVYFVPGANWNGNTSFTYTATDDLGAVSNVATAGIVVTPVTDGFTDANETLTVAEDSGVSTGSLLTGTSSVDGMLTITGFSLAGQSGPFILGAAYAMPGQGTITVNADGNYSFTPAPNWNGNFPVLSYTVSDGFSTDTSTLSITVTSVVDPLVDSSETISVAEDSGTTSGSLLTGTSSVEGPLTITGFSVAGQGGPFTLGAAYAVADQGTITVNTDGTYSFTPASNWNGSFPVVSYTVSDGSSTDTSTLTITVTPVTDGFTDANETLTVAEDSGVSTGSLLTGTSSVDGNVTIQSFSLAGQVGPFTLGTAYQVQGQGTITVSADGSYSFSPAANWNGSFPVINYTVSDGTSTDTSTLTIGVTPVNDAPVASNTNASGAEDATSIAINLVATDVDGTIDHYTVTALPQHGVLYSDAALTKALVAGDTVTGGTVYFVPTANWSGSTGFGYSATDAQGLSSAPATATIAVTPVADAPSIVSTEPTPAVENVGLTFQYWTGRNWGGGGNGFDGTTLETNIENLIKNNTVPNGIVTNQHVLDSQQNFGGANYTTTVAAGTAVNASGFIYMEAGKTYTMLAAADDGFRMVVGDPTTNGKVLDLSWGADGGAFKALEFQPLESGFYSFEMYMHNQAGAGWYRHVEVFEKNDALTAELNRIPKTVAALDEALNAHPREPLNFYPNLAAIKDQISADDNFRLSDITGSNDRGHYKVYGYNEGEVGEKIPVQPIKVTFGDLDGSEAHTVTLSGVPEGVTISDGVHSFTAAGGLNSVDASDWNLGKLSIDATSSSDDFTLTVTAKAAETGSQSVATVTQEIVITVHEADVGGGIGGEVRAAPPEFFVESFGLANLDTHAFQADEPHAPKLVLSELLVTEQGESSMNALLSFLPPGSAVGGASEGLGHPAGESVAYTPPVASPLDDDLHHANLMVVA